MQQYLQSGPVQLARIMLIAVGIVLCAIFVGRAIGQAGSMEAVRGVTNDQPGVSISQLL